MASVYIPYRHQSYRQENVDFGGFLVMRPFFNFKTGGAIIIFLGAHPRISFFIAPRFNGIRPLIFRGILEFEGRKNDIHSYL